MLMDLTLAVINISKGQEQKQRHSWETESKRDMRTWSWPLGHWGSTLEQGREACWWPVDGQPSTEPVASCGRRECRGTPRDNLPLSHCFRGPGVVLWVESQGLTVRGAIVPAHELWVGGGRATGLA